MKKVSIYTIALAVFLILYSLWIISQMNTIQLSYDESRHAAGGMLWYDYIKTIVSDGYVHFDDFVNQYQKMGYNAGWFANQDPAVDGLIRTPFYFLFGPTFFAIRVMALVCALISAVLLYLIGCYVTKKKIIALSAAIIMLMSTLFYMYTTIQALAPIPIIMMTLFWYYFTFIRISKKNYTLKLFKLGEVTFTVNFSWNILMGGLFLTLATLIQYAAALFIDIFFVMYILYLIIASYLKNRKISVRLISESGALQIIFIAFLQNLTFLLISYKWLKYNLFEMHWLERIRYYTSYASSCAHDLNYLSQKYPWIAFGTPFSNFTYMIHGYLQRTLFFTIFFAYTIYCLFKKKIEDEETKKHFIIITLFFLAIYLYFSFNMSNHQIRYIAHAFPFVILASAYGLYQLVFSKLKQNQVWIYGGIILLFVGGLFIVDGWMYDKTFQEFGSQNDELLDYLRSKPPAKVLLHAPGTGSSLPPQGDWYYNPDYVMFTFMRAKEGYNPFVFKQQGHLFEYQRDSLEAVDYAAKNLVQQLKTIPLNIPVYMIVYRYHEPGFYSAFGKHFLENGFSAQNLTYWTIYYRE
ncbi:hypothetical protein J4229_03280 [Candidatus Pacearchaeota archaeon]|nr:hypothetical protein [Candidatus Pacearchaeota archaeon]